jgi:hypothetical protein
MVHIVKTVRGGLEHPSSLITLICGRRRIHGCPQRSRQLDFRNRRYYGRSVVSQFRPLSRLLSVLSNAFPTRTCFSRRGRNLYFLQTEPALTAWCVTATNWTSFQQSPPLKDLHIVILCTPLPCTETLLAVKHRGKMLWETSWCKLNFLSSVSLPVQSTYKCSFMIEWRTFRFGHVEDPCIAKIISTRRDSFRFTQRYSHSAIQLLIYTGEQLRWPPLWSSGQRSWLQNGHILCFLWGTNWIYICYVEERTASVV